jgi:RimJ/RimL family protein N-acetyltransferase
LAISKKTQTTKNIHIGNIIAYIDSNNKTADISILIGNIKEWGKGYGLEALRSVITYLFNNKKVRKVTMGTMSTNKQMLRIMEKLRMLNDGKRNKHYLMDGKEVDIIHKALFNKKYNLGIY